MMTMTLEVNMKADQKTIIKRSFAISILLVISISCNGTAMAASGIWKRVKSGFNRDISAVTGSARWGVVPTKISRSPLLKKRVADFLERHDIETLDSYALWLKKNVRYKADLFGDSWSSPEETLKRRRGDCEDFAFLSEEVLSQLGYEPYVIAFMRRDTGDWHAICAFKEEGLYNYFDNFNLVKTRTESLECLTRLIGAKSDLLILSANTIANIFCGTINLGGFARGAKLEKKDGKVRIVSN